MAYPRPGNTVYEVLLAGSTLSHCYFLPLDDTFQAPQMLSKIISSVPPLPKEATLIFTPEGRRKEVCHFWSLCPLRIMSHNLQCMLCTLKNQLSPIAKTVTLIFM